jgi:molybdopterin synthase catalytic subunit
MSKVAVQHEDFDVSKQLELLCADRTDIGATATFVGYVRDNNLDDDVAGMQLEHYPGMTEQSLQQIADEAAKRWGILDTTIIHRIGELIPSDQIVLVAVASAHRGEAFAACKFIMDYLKTDAPFWKKELLKDGSTRWVEARASDDDTARGWNP